jgi:type II secretory ATPase GspE/PulE/Tfp pilus assembly ATPase PilB-like protein
LPAPCNTIEEAAVKAGTHLMLTQALKKAASGVTSFEEVYRVVADA